MCEGVCVTSSNLTSYPPFLFVPHSLLSTQSRRLGLAALFIFLLSFCFSTHVSIPLFSFYLRIAISRYQCLYFYLHTSYILITLSFYLHLSNLLLYAATLSGHPSSSFLSPTQLLNARKIYELAWTTTHLDLTHRLDA